MKKKIIIFSLALVMVLALCGPAWAGYSITISKADNKLALHEDGQLVRVLPVATGKKPSYTPEGTFKIACKIVDPYYSRKQIPGGSPRNPLGPRWLGLNIRGGGIYGIHGTNNPSSIGTYASAGCIRMHNRDVIWLAGQVSTGTPVIINNLPIDESTRLAPVQLATGDKTTTLPRDCLSILREDTVFTPLRSTAEITGWVVTWNHDKNAVQLKKGAGIISTAPGDSLITVNGEQHRLNAVPLLVENRFYMPVQFWDHVPGITARWKREEKELTLYTQ